ncbi:4-(cytidine 5'-diphospho)-2-C-methyl-D-erythritol kinase [Fuscibacter oryzae]|uniref:4-diphosphocytidyl-2-C-methyl-D-erythritol kinase n=1 Tax=Fuscibacter oryzae TaxID=2803939 RepID=A0A8J7SRL4_9RHOB|nr:4-(cytidine 5'-diphospho)-2-C-methyl-D-erythritol kinase [Fuscibacter oryzae]MBL4927020.1 4-(cytidine 5'-diphospho)-2-C-methyl-D-erythritol kinase [Fuscibacter oryzae]
MAAEMALARAKVNLCLHVMGQRADGYHLLDSLVVFAGTGDRITVTPAADLSLTVTGPQGAGLGDGPDNLCLRAARVFGLSLGAAITLDKHLPVASGVGGGSADAAAVLGALSRLWGVALPDAAAVLTLGADVPVCLAGVPARMRGVGEQVDPVRGLPAAWLVLVNPGVSLSTPAVFRALARRDNPGLPDALPYWSTAQDLAAFLRQQRNDLEPAALTLVPQVGQVTAALGAQAGCLLARMSGSGATCFGLFSGAAQAEGAAQALRRAQPGWWVQAAAMAS